jgi:hypothetical protein
MGKFTDKGLVPPDDPMFSTGPELFSRRGSSASSTTSASATDGATQAPSTSATKRAPESVNEQADGAYRLAKMQHQNKQLLAQGKPQPKLPPGVKRK